MPFLLACRSFPVFALAPPDTVERTEERLRWTFGRRVVPAKMRVGISASERLRPLYSVAAVLQWFSRINGVRKIHINESKSSAYPGGMRTLLSHLGVVLALFVPLLTVIGPSMIRFRMYRK